MSQDQQNDEVTVLEVNPETIYQQDKALIDIQISTARAYPRSIKRSVENAIAIVTMDVETASTCTYSLPRGGKSLTGPSVHLAKILAQVWGNMRTESKIVDIGQKQVTSQSIAWDLESNLAMKGEIKRSIMTKNGRMSDDMIVVTGNAANSISLRNAIFSVIPQNVVNKVYKAAVQTITGDVSDKNKLIAKRKHVVEALKETYSLTEEQITGALGKISIDHITQEDIVTLIGMGQAVKDGAVSLEEQFKSIVKVRATPKDQTEQRLTTLIKEAPNAEVLEQYKKDIKPGTEQQTLFDQRLEELNSKKEPKGKK